jgi:hypothetical protein
MEKQLEEIKISLDSLHERLDRLFYWTGFVQQESKVRYKALSSKDSPDLESGNQSPQDSLEARLLKLKEPHSHSSAKASSSTSAFLTKETPS